MSKIKTVLVAGLGRFGISLCGRLSELGQRIVAVDINKDAVKAVADLAELAAQLDVTDEDALEKIGAREVDVAVVAIGNNIEAAIMATAILQGFKIPRIFARADSALTEKILKRIGANKIVRLGKEMGEMVAEEVVYPHLSHFFQLPGEDFFVGKITPHPDMIGKTLNMLQLDRIHDVAVVLVRSGEKRIISDTNVPVEENDRFMLLGRVDEADEVENLISRIERGKDRE